MKKNAPPPDAFRTVSLQHENGPHNGRLRAGPFTEQHGRREIKVDGRVTQRGQHARRLLRPQLPHGHQFAGAVVHLEQSQAVFVVGQHHQVIVLGTARVPSDSFHVRQVSANEEFVLQKRRATEKKRKSQISSSHSIVRLLREKHGDCDIFSSTRARFKNKETSIRHIMWDCILYCLGRHSPVNFIKKNYFVRVRTLKGIQWWLRNKIFKMKTFAES